MKRVILILSILSVQAQAGGPSPRVLKVIYDAAREYNVNAQHLIKIAFVESKFKADATRQNANGTVDYGMFQINSVHWTTTCQDLDVFKLKGNAQCAARLIKSIEKHADRDPNWLGRYHSKTPSLKRKYFQLLKSAPKIIFASVTRSK